MGVRAIYLVGFSGTGKSTVATLVAGQLGWNAIDLDEVIADRAATTIPLIFEREGEAGFRTRETNALREVSAGGRVVVATGGGALVRDENRGIMERHGWIVALEARPETILARIRGQKEKAEPGAVRPLLEAEDALDQIRTLKQARQSLYALADWTVHTDRLSPSQVATEVVRACGLLEQSS